MTDANDTKLIQELLGSDLMKEIVKECGLESAPAETQAELLSMIGKNIVGRVVVEILKTVPTPAHKKFEALIGKGDVDALRAFLEPHIPDLDDFIAREARKEYETTKAHASGV